MEELAKRQEPVTREPPRERRAVRAIAVVGLGYVGLPLAILAETRGFSVRGFDIDERKMRHLVARDVPYLSAEEDAQFRASRMRVSTDERILEGADAYIICVPTPVDESFEPDLAPLVSASEAVGRHVTDGALVVVESTVNPGVCEAVSLKAIERASGLAGGTDFSFAHCPERINPAGDPSWSARSIPRVVGGLDDESLARATQLYERILDGELFPMRNIKEAEAVKMVENAFRDINIAFVNELAMSFQKAGIDIVHVIEGASTKPFAFMPHTPGCGVGGHCIPVDPYYLIRYGRENGFEHRFLQTARDINNGMPRYTVDLLERTVRETLAQPLPRTVVALLGLSYKRDVPDLRESPAIAIREELRERGAFVRTFDPLVPHEGTSESLEQALMGADAAIVATDHTLFRSLSPADFAARGVRVVVDGRNCLSKDAFLDAGLAYRGIGR